MGDENDLQINITAEDDASAVLDGVAASSEGMAETIAEAATAISTSLDNAFSASEEAAIESATASAEAWMGATEDIDGAVASVAESTDEFMMSMDDAALAAASSVSEGWTASLQEIASLGAMTEEEVSAAFAGMAASAEEGASKSMNSMSGMHSYFKILIAGYLAQTAGKGLIGFVQDFVGAAAGDPTQLKTLTDQLAEQQAALQKLKLPISGHNLTSAVLGADQAEQQTKIAQAKDSIAKLKEEIAPLATAQAISGKSAQDYATAMQNLNTAITTFLATGGAPLLEYLAKGADALDHFITALTKWEQENPKTTETILLMMGIIGGLLVVFGTILIAIAPVIIIFGLMGVAMSGATLAIAAAITAIVLLVAFIAAYLIANWGNIEKATVAAWNAISDSLKKIWADIVAILMPGVKALEDYLSQHWDAIQTDVQVAWNAIFNFIQGIWGKIVSGAEAAIGSVQKLINNIMGPINALTGAVSSIGGAIGSGASSVFSSIPKFADGGIVNGATLALVGEAGPEAIIPLSAFNGGGSMAGVGGGSGSGLNIIFNIASLQGTDQAAAQRFAAQLAQMIGRQLKLKNYS